MNLLIRLIILVTILGASAVATPPNAHWIWHDEDSDSGTFIKDFESREIQSAFLDGVADFCRIDVSLNGTHVKRARPFDPRFGLDCTGFIKGGKNRLTVKVSGIDGPSAFQLRLQLKSKEDDAYVITDATWREEKSRNVVDRGPVNPRYWDAPHDRVQVTVMDDYEQWKRAIKADESTSASTFELLPGYQIERIRSAKEDEDSWISMAFDGQGRVILSKEKEGLLRLTLRGTEVAKVETINSTMRESRGLLFHQGDIFVNAKNHRSNSKAGGGLFRLRDTNGDDQFDEEKLLGENTATGGHGRNDIALGPDGKIYMIHGDSVAVPKKFKDLTSPVPHHLPGDDRPHGHVMRTDVDGKEWELVCKGLRNPFGIHFNTEGQMFTYDADAEFDMGAPWYRPTRVRHLVAGADYGWRRVTGSWPPYYPDHADEPPNTLDIGKGSPTAVKFGTKSHFPSAYQKALYILDWTYGRIIAIHMTPRGASYACRSEVFLRGQPANVTDLGFGPDGAMYFVTGGRGTQSGLYRVSYTGKKEPPRVSIQEKARVAHGKNARKIRQQLERARVNKLGGPLVLKHLADSDPWLRHAARLNLEFAGIAAIKHALDDRKPDVSLAAHSALARWNSERLLGASGIYRFNWKSLTPARKLELLRIHERALEAAAKVPASSPRDKHFLAVRKLKDRIAYLQHFPDSDAQVNWELVRLMVLNPSHFTVERIMEELRLTDDERTRLHYLYLIRELKEGWTPELRQQYFAALRQTKSHRAGRGMSQFYDRIAKDALNALDPAERSHHEVKKESGFSKLLQEYQKAMAGRSFVKEWKTADLQPLLNKAKIGSNPKKGREAYLVASCALCHQLGAEGRIFGPDLTSVAQRFSRRDLLESIIHPSKVVSEKYRNTTITMQDGAKHTGRILYRGDYRNPNLQLSTNPLDPEAIVQLRKEHIASREDSLVSAMPGGLLNPLTLEEIGELLVFIETGGRADHPAYRIGVGTAR